MPQVTFSFQSESQTFSQSEFCSGIKRRALISARAEDLEEERQKKLLLRSLRSSSGKEQR